MLRWISRCSFSEGWSSPKTCQGTWLCRLPWQVFSKLQPLLNSQRWNSAQPLLPHLLQHYLLALVAHQVFPSESLGVFFIVLILNTFIYPPQGQIREHAHSCTLDRTGIHGFASVTKQDKTTVLYTVKLYMSCIASHKLGFWLKYMYLKSILQSTDIMNLHTLQVFYP